MVLNGSSGGESGDTTAARAKMLRDNIIIKLASSGFLDGPNCKPATSSSTNSNGVRPKAGDKDQSEKPSSQNGSNEKNESVEADAGAGDGKPDASSSAVGSSNDPESSAGKPSKDDTPGPASALSSDKASNAEGTANGGPDGTKTSSVVNGSDKPSAEPLTVESAAMDGVVSAAADPTVVATKVTSGPDLPDTKPAAVEAVVATKVSSGADLPDIKPSAGEAMDSSDKQVEGKPAEAGAAGASSEEAKTTSEAKNNTETAETASEQSKKPLALSVSDLDDEARKAAETRLEMWRSMLRQTKEAKPMWERFPLNGPISCLISTAVQNFLTSTKMKYLHDFLALRKTETSAIVEMFKIWRQKCSLSDVSGFGIAKYIICVASRLGRALSIPPVHDPNMKRWLMDPISVLTGAPRDFLVGVKKIYSAAAFLEMRTKDVALELEVWRTEQKMPPLKGSGKVAMISAWKAACRESIDAESSPGKVLTDIDLEVLADAETVPKDKGKGWSEAAPKQKRAKRKAKSLEVGRKEIQQSSIPSALPPSESLVLDELGRPRPPRTRGSPTESLQGSAVSLQGSAVSLQGSAVPDEFGRPRPSRKRGPIGSLSVTGRLQRLMTYTLHCSLFLSDVVGPDEAKLLSSANIKTVCFQRWSVVYTLLCNRHAAQFSSSLFFKAHDLFEANRRPDSPLCQAILKGDLAKSDLGCHLVIEGWIQRLREELEQLRAATVATSEPASKKQKVGPGAGHSHGRKSYHNISDPYEALSEVTKRFLSSINITSAQKFLESRTTDIANAFVQWREEENMPELKGLGAIASVSGWKAQVRKAAKELGLADVADAEPDNKASWGKEAREAAARRKPPPSRPVVPVVPTQKITHPDLLFGKSRRQFAVQAIQGKLSVIQTLPGYCDIFFFCLLTNTLPTDDSSRVFHFDLSVRVSADGPGPGIFITYEGEGKTDDKPKSVCEVPHAIVGGRGKESQVPVLSELSLDGSSHGSIARTPFATLKPGCGLIDIRPFGVRPTLSQDLSSMCNEIRKFVAAGTFSLEEPTTNDNTSSPNVHVRVGPDCKVHYLLFYEKPVEKGQTASLRFPTILSNSRRFKNSNLKEQQMLQETISTLCRLDLEKVRKLVKSEMFQPLELELRVLQTVGAFERVRDILMALRRLNWLLMEIDAAMGDQKSDVGDSTYFDFQGFLTDSHLSEKFTEERCQDLQKEMMAEAKKDLLTVLELDALCGAARRSRRFPWCKVASQVFDHFVEEMMKLYCSSSSFPTQASEMINAILKGVYSVPLLREDCIVEYNGSRSADGPIGNEGSLHTPITAYQDALSLCGAVGYLDTVESAESSRHIVCDVPQMDVGDASTEAERISHLFALGRPADVEDGSFSLSLVWYRQLQLQVATTVVSRFISSLSPVERARFDVDEIMSSMKQSVEKDLGLKNLQQLQLRSQYASKIVLPASVSQTALYEPHSFQFFLGLVWPALRKAGWRLDAGGKPSDVTFVPPSPNGRVRKGVKKRRRDRQRAQLQREVNEVGMGFVPKSLKRLFAKTVSPVETKDGSGASTSAADTTPKATVKDALDKFLVQIDSGLKEDQSQGRERAAAVIASIRSLFDELAPKFVDKDDDRLTGAKPPSEVLGCEVLMRLLLVLPSVLRQPGLDLKHVSDCIGIARELADFLVANHQQMFDDRFHLDDEHYAGKEKTNPYDLTARLRRFDDVTKSTSDDGMDISGSQQPVELVLPSDKPNLTDYVACVMEQAAPIRATDDDIRNKGRRVQVGFPGLACRHCHGSGGEGRYFFTSPESLSACVTIMDKQ